MAAGYEATKSFTAKRQDIEEMLLVVLNDLGLRWLGELSGKDVMTVRVPINDCSWGEKIEVQFIGSNTLRVSSKCILPLQLYDWGKNRKNVLAIMSGIQVELDKRRRLRENSGHFEAGEQCGQSVNGEGNRFENGRGSEKCDDGSAENGLPGGLLRMTVEEALSVLGLAEDADREEIQTAYRMQAKRYHPDQVPLGLADDFKKLAEEKMKVINEAYGILTRTCD